MKMIFVNCVQKYFLMTMFIKKLNTCTSFKILTLKSKLTALTKQVKLVYCTIVYNFINFLENNNLIYFK